MKERKFECRICIPASSESAIRRALEKALPSMQWEEGDSSWDKIKVWGEGRDAQIGVSRYEGPGPFNLRIFIRALEGAGAEKAYLALRDTVLRALKGRVWKPLTPQRVTLVKLEGRFPAAYEFECDLGMAEIKGTFDDADFGHWEALEKEPHGFHLEGWLPFRLAGRAGSGVVRITGKQPCYRIEVVPWQVEPDRAPACDQLHETVQNTLLPAIGARHVRAAD